MVLLRGVLLFCLGTRVSLLGDRVAGVAGEGMLALEPDRRLFVYDAERDAVETFDCGIGR